MKLVILESPFAASPEAPSIASNIDYARAAVRDALLRDEAPIASHLLYTQPGVLRDEVPSDRSRGMRAGLAWGRVAEETVVYIDRGVSTGMRAGITRAVKEGRPVWFRSLVAGASASEVQIRWETALGLPIQKARPPREENEKA